MDEAFTTDELRRLEQQHPDGLSVQAVVEMLRERGITLAEATFRKYVQLGLLPRSRRVGRKGKHRGSHGLYPSGVVGRIAEIRRLMDGGLTLEEIQRSAVAFANEIDAVRVSSEALLTKLELEATERAPQRAQAASRRVAQLRAQAEALVEALLEAADELCPATPRAQHEGDAASLAKRPARDVKGRRPAKVAAAGRVGRSNGGARP